MKPTHFEKEHWIIIPVFGYHIYVVITSDVVESRKWREDVLGKYKLTGITTALCSTNKDEDWYSYIFFNQNASSGIIAHEVYHALCNLFRYVDAAHEEEVFAYHLTYVIEEIDKFKKVKLIKYKP